MEWKIPFIDLDTNSGKTFHSICSKVNSNKKAKLKVKWKYMYNESSTYTDTRLLT